MNRRGLFLELLVLSLLFLTRKVTSLHGTKGVLRVSRGYSRVRGCEKEGVEARSSRRDAAHGSGDAPLVNPNADAEYQEYDVIDAATLDTTIEDAVQRIIDDALKVTSSKSELTPVEKFQIMYREMKQTKRERKDGSAGKLDSAVMLEQLLGGAQTLDPFDERKVMMKLRSMLTQEDFKELFLDDKIGDWL